MISLVPFILLLVLVGCGSAAPTAPTAVAEPISSPAQPAPPLTAEFTPTPDTLITGTSAQYLVRPSGGRPDANASWICSSSNMGLAKVATTPPGCDVLGIAPGTVTLTATVTNGYETINIGAALKVVPPSAPPEPPAPLARFGSRSDPASLGETVRYELDRFAFDGVGTLALTLRAVIDGEAATNVVATQFPGAKALPSEAYVYLVAEIRAEVLAAPSPTRPVKAPLAWLNWRAWTGNVSYPQVYDFTIDATRTMPMGSWWTTLVPLIVPRDPASDLLLSYQFYPQSVSRLGEDHGAWFMLRETSP